MKKIAFLYYRNWAYEILKYISILQLERRDFIISDVICPHGLEDDLSFLSADTTTIHYIDPEKSSDLVAVVQQAQIELIFCYSWSWIIPESLVRDCYCICLHPSRLPAYRGGSPIQNQVLNGDVDSAVSVLRMNRDIDSGPIYRQICMNIDAPIEEVFERMSGIGCVITKSLITDYLMDDLKFYEQDHEKATLVKRRSPKDSCLRLGEMGNVRYEDFHRMVNVLRDPYPNVYFDLKDCQIRIQQVHAFRNLPQDQDVSYLSVASTHYDLERGPIFLKLLDRFALISQYTIERV